MIYIRFLSIFFAISLLGCTSLSFKEIRSLPALFQNRELDQRLLYESNQNSFLILKLGSSDEVTMVLSNINNGVFKWVSKDFDEIYTLNGRIVAVNGFDINYKTDLRSELISSNDKVIYFKSNFRNPDLFFSPTKSILISVTKTELVYLGNKFSVSQHEELIKMESVYWSSKNIFYYDTDNQPIQSIQSVSPLHPKFKLTFFYK